MLAHIEKHGRKISTLCFGAAQLGMHYGVANQTGMPDEVESEAILKKACEMGITLFDTASAYQLSEQRIGAFLKHAPSPIGVITKLSPLAELDSNASVSQAIESVESSVQHSLHCLGLKSFPYLLLHRFEHIHAWKGALWQHLLGMQRQGYIERLGASVSVPEEALSLISMPSMECIQLPYNILDRRWELAGVPLHLQTRNDILVLTRSALLQGVFTQDPVLWPGLPKAESTHLHALLSDCVIKYDRLNMVDLCFAYVRAQPWIDSVVVGMETQQQLEDNVALFSNKPLSQKEILEISEKLPLLPDVFLNPALWPR